MKPVHVAILGALLAVAAIVFLLGEDDPRRPGPRRTSPDDGLRPIRQVRDPNALRRANEARDAARAIGNARVQLRFVDEEGQPVANAAWELTGPTPGRGTAHSDGTVALKQQRPGHYRIEAQTSRLAGTATFTVGGDTDLGDVVMRPALALGGRVFDPFGKPVAGARVEAVEPSAASRAAGQEMFAGRRTVWAGDATTDAEGRYTVRVPGAGEYGISVSARGYALAFAPFRPYQKERTDLDFHLVPGDGVVGRIWGEGEPLAGALVRLQTGVRNERLEVETITDAEGRFELATNSNWSRLYVEAVGFAPHTRQVETPGPVVEISLTRGISLRARAVAQEGGEPLADMAAVVQLGGFMVRGSTKEDGTCEFHALPFRESQGRGALYLGSGDFAPRLVALESLEPIEGWIDLGDVELGRGGVVTGRVLDGETKRPVADVVVRGFGGRWQLMAAAGPSTRSDAQGRYELRGVPLDVLTLVASHPDYVAPLDFGELMGPNRKPLFAESKTLQRDLELSRPSEIRIRVVDPDGAPIPDARVKRTRQTRPFAAFFEATAHAWITDEQGSATIRGLAPGEAVPVIATHPRFGDSPETMLRAGTEATLELTAPTAITGTVTDEDGRPVAGAKATVRPEQAKQRGARRPVIAAPGVTDAAGRFAIRNAPAGRLELRIEHPGYRIATQALRATGKTLDAGTIRLERGAYVTGITVDENDNPLEHVNVRVSARFQGGGLRMRDAAEGRTFAATRSGPDGRFEFFGLHPDARYEIQASHHDRYSDRPLVAVNTRDVRLVLQRAVTLRGVVLGNGTPVPEATVYARIQGVHRGFARTDKSGAFEIGRLPPGTPIDIEVNHPAFARLQSAGHIAGNAPIRLAMDAGARIGGRVVDEDGNAVRLWIRVRQGDEQRDIGPVGTDGTFLVGGFGSSPDIELQWNGNGDHIPPPPQMVKPGTLDLKIVVKRGLTIKGRVLESNGQPANGLEVYVLNDLNERIRSTFLSGPKGEFTLRGLPEGSYTVVVARGNGVYARQERVRAGTTDLELRVTR